MLYIERKVLKWIVRREEEVIYTSKKFIEARNFAETISRIENRPIKVINSTSNVAKWLKKLEKLAF